MTRKTIIALALASFAGAAVAAQGDFRLEVDTVRPAGLEDTALQGYVLLRPGSAGSRAVGMAGRAYSTSNGPDNTAWGMVSEAINFPAAQGNAVGIESGVVNMAPENAGQLRGLDVVFKNRMDSSIDEAVPSVGANRFNESSAALFVSSQPRSPAGEYSGWQAGIRFARWSVDRSASRPYAAAIDVSDVEVDAPFYFVVWRCGGLRCALQLTSEGVRVVKDIDGTPTVAR